MIEVATITFILSEDVLRMTCLMPQHRSDSQKLYLAKSQFDVFLHNSRHFSASCREMLHLGNVTISRVIPET
jgi:hypothetical protein